MQTSPLVHCMYTNCHTMACWLPRHVSPMYVRVRTHNTSLGASALPWLRNLVQSIGIWSLSVTPYTRLPDVHFSSKSYRLRQGRLRRVRHLLHLCKIL
jgi:hypothetical protein